MDRLVWPGGRIPRDGSKECIVESLRAFLGADMTCNTAIIYLCTSSFLFLALILLVIVLFLKRRSVSSLRTFCQFVFEKLDCRRHRQVFFTRVSRSPQVRSETPPDGGNVEGSEHLQEVRRVGDSPEQGGHQPKVGRGPVRHRVRGRVPRGE